MVNDLFKIVKKVPNYIYGKQIVYEFYETFFGICDHTVSNSPLSSVAYHKAENYIIDGLYDTYLRVYIMKDLKNKLGLNIEEFLSLPKYRITRILEIVDELDKKKNNAEDNAYKEIKKVQQS